MGQLLRILVSVRTAMTDCKLAKLLCTVETWLRRKPDRSISRAEFGESGYLRFDDEST